MNNIRVTKTHGHQDAMSAVASQRPKACDLRPATRKRIITTLLIFAVVWLILPQTIQAAEYYVDAVNGNNANSGTSEQPWKTLDRAYTWYSGSGPKAQEGDTVLFRNGNYGTFTEDTNSGAAYLFYRNDWITYKAAPGHSPNLTAINVNNYDKWPPLENGRSYLKFEGFNITGCPASFKSTSYVQVIDCNISSVPVNISGYYEPYIDRDKFGIYLREVNNSTLEGNHIHNVGQGIQVKAKNCLIKDNVIHHTCDDGIVLDGSSYQDYITVEGNHIYDIRKYASTIDVYGTFNGTFIEGETVTMPGSDFNGVASKYIASGPYLRVFSLTEHTPDYWFEQEGYTQLVGQSSGATINPITKTDPIHTDCLSHDARGTTAIFHIIIRNNWFDRRRYVGPGSLNGNAIKLWGGDRTIICTIENNVIDAQNIAYFGGLADAKMNNNLFYSFDKSTDFYTDYGSMTISEMYNNIITKPSFKSNDKGYTITIEKHGNNIFGHTPSNIYGFTVNETEVVMPLSSVSSLFVDAAASPGDFNLAPSSLAIDFGDPNYGPSADILGHSRVGAPDAGCYEYGTSEVILGDISADAQISAFDAALAAHIAVDLAHPDIKNRAAAEVSGDAEVSAYDAALIAQRAVGLIEKFPI